MHPSFPLFGRRTRWAKRNNLFFPKTQLLHKQAFKSRQDIGRIRCSVFCIDHAIPVFRKLLSDKFHQAAFLFDHPALFYKFGVIRHHGYFVAISGVYKRRYSIRFIQIRHCELVPFRSQVYLCFPFVMPQIIKDSPVLPLLLDLLRLFRRHKFDPLIKRRHICWHVADVQEHSGIKQKFRKYLRTYPWPHTRLWQLFSTA